MRTGNQQLKRSADIEFPVPDPEQEASAKKREGP